MRVSFRPLVWAGPQTPASSRRSVPSRKARWPDTVDRLERELAGLGTTELVIEVGFASSDIGRDGLPLARARPPVFPGVRLVAQTQHGPLTFSTDVCDFWQHNVLSIARGLGALRALNRHGITSGGEQYAGFRDLGSGPGGWTSSEPPFTDALSALRWLRDPAVCGSRGAEGAALKSVLRLVARQTHPDHGGTREQWDRYQEAHRLLSDAGMI